MNQVNKTLNHITLALINYAFLGKHTQLNTK